MIGIVLHLVVSALPSKINSKDLFNTKYHRPKPTVYRIFNTKYGIALCHDFPDLENFSDTYAHYIPQIQEKYTRRIQRFYEVCDNSKHVYFFRLAPHLSSLNPQWQHDVYQGKKEIIAIRDTLLEIFPKKNWTLIAIGGMQEYQLNWNLLHVKNFHVHDVGGSNTKEWHNIFTQLGLLSQ